MLLNLHVKNMALIDEIEIDFSDRLNILTGETGAGKSILLGALNAALGGKVAKDAVRKGADYGLVELAFSIDREGILQKIRSFDLPVEDDGILVITRKIIPSYKANEEGKGGEQSVPGSHTVKNRSISKINGQTVTLSALREVSSLLIDIHGQHEHQSLLKKKEHLKIVDSYGKKEIEPVKKEVLRAYSRYRELLNALKGMDIDEEERLRELQFLRFEIEQIEQAKLVPGEDEVLEKDYKKMCASKTILKTAGEVYRLMGYEGEQSVGTLLGRAVRQFASVTGLDGDASSIGTQLGELDSLCNDLNRDLSVYLTSLEFDDEAFREIEERIDLICGLKAKYGQTIEKIGTYLEKQKRREEELFHLGERKEALSKKAEGARKDLDGWCKKLSVLRQKYGRELSLAIRDALVDLNFLDVKFQIDFFRLELYTAEGYDGACFMISTNPGEPLCPLTEIASGGELSRIMLAIKSILAKVDTVDTLVFDEIDVGISGRTAQMVSEKMSHIAGSHQVIAITHLPQIAAMADSHYFIEKRAEASRTSTSITKLSHEASVRELARMLGGVEITDRVLENAGEMKEMAEKVKKY